MFYDSFYTPSNNLMIHNFEDNKGNRINMSNCVGKSKEYNVELSVCMCSWHCFTGCNDSRKEKEQLPHFST